MQLISKSFFLSAAIILSAEAGFAACTVPNQLANGQVADADQVMANLNALASCADNASPAGVPNALQYNAGSGKFGAVPPLTNGQIVIGSTGSAPQASTLTAGPGVTIQNSAGGITISAAGGGGGGVDWLNQAAVVKPSVGNFTLQTSTSAPTGASLAGTARGVALTATGAPSNTAMMAEVDAPSGKWQATMLAVYSGPISSYVLGALSVRDVTSSRAVHFGMAGGGGTSYRFLYERTNGGVGLNSYVSDAGFQDIGLPSPVEPVWSRLTYDGASFIWSFSRDGEYFVNAYTISSTDYLTNVSKIGPAVTFQQVAKPSWPAAYHVLSWSVVSIQ